MTTALLSPASALIAHIEPLVADRRILVVGNAEHSIAEHLLDRGARLVQILDPDARRVAHAAAHNSERRVTYAQLTDASLRDGSFELALVEDANLTDDFPRLVSGVRRSMNNRGVAVICTTNPDSTNGLLGISGGRVDYDTLAETTEDLFESVIMLGQSPFLGYSVVQFDLEHPPEPALDNAYLNEEGETPDFYIALCGSEDAMAEVALEDMSIVQLSAARFVENSEQIHREKERRAARRVESLEGELRTAQSRGSDQEVERLTRELEQRDTWIKKLESRAETADARADDAENELEELEKELETTHQTLLKQRNAHEEEFRKLRKAHEQELRKLREARDQETAKAGADDQELAKLKKALEQARAHAEEAKHLSAGSEALEEEIEELHNENKKLSGKVNDKSRALEKLEKRLAESEKELDDLHDQLDETEDLLVKARQNDTGGTTPAEVERDLRGLEEQLKKRGERITELEGQLKKLETFAKTLTAELSTKASGGGSADQSEVDALAKALAEREADLVAAQWTIGQLKQSALKD